MLTTNSNEAFLIRKGRADEIAYLQTVDTAARSRYAGHPGFEFVVQAPSIAPERFHAGDIWVVQRNETIVGFILLQSHGDTVYLANISVVPEASGHNIGAMLVKHAIARARAERANAVTLATFRVPPWNGPWFRRQGFEPMPENRIGPMLRTILDSHAQSLDMSTRETLWHPT